MDRCGRCDRLVDTDHDTEFYTQPYDKPRCESCRDDLGSCDFCSTVLDEEGDCPATDCPGIAERKRDEKLDDPRRGQAEELSR